MMPQAVVAPGVVLGWLIQGLQHSSPFPSWGPSSVPYLLGQAWKEDTEGALTPVDRGSCKSSEMRSSAPGQRRGREAS